MKTHCLAAVLLSLAACLAQTPPEPKAGPVGEKEAEMPDKIDEATDGLREFTATRDPAAIEKAVDSLEEFDIWSLSPDQRLAARQRLLTSWSWVLVAIDRVKEPGFDPEADPPAARPPASPSPEELADYEKNKAGHHGQVLLVELEERAIEASHRATETLYTKSGPDQKELEEVFEKTTLSEARQQQIREGLEPPADPYEPADPD